MQTHALALVESDSIGEGTRIDAFAVIRAGAIIGRGVRIHPHVVIEPGVVIGDGTEVFPGAVLGRRPSGAGATARSLAYEQRVDIGRDCSIGPHAVVYCDVAIGRNTLIGDGASIREGARIGSRCIISRYVTLNYNVIVGDGTKIMDVSHITGNSTIGAGVFISTGVLSTNDNAMGRVGTTHSASLAQQLMTNQWSAPARSFYHARRLVPERSWARARWSPRTCPPIRL